MLSAAAKAAQSGISRDFQTLGDLQQLRAFITGPVILMMLDAPVAPFYLLAVYPDPSASRRDCHRDRPGADRDRARQPEAHGGTLRAGQHVCRARQPGGRCHGAQLRK